MYTTCLTVGLPQRPPAWPSLTPPVPRRPSHHQHRSHSPTRSHSLTRRPLPLTIQSLDPFPAPSSAPPLVTLSWCEDSKIHSSEVTGQRRAAPKAGTTYWTSHVSCERCGICVAECDTSLSDGLPRALTAGDYVITLKSELRERPGPAIKTEQE